VSPGGPFDADPTLAAVSPDGVSLAVFRATPATSHAEAAAGAASDASDASDHASDAASDAADVDARPALLLVHGATADHTTWRAVGPIFATRREVFALDRRGRGASGDAEPYAIEREYEDIAAAAEILAARSGGPIDVVGHSYGGRVALGASQLTDALRRVVVYEGAPVPVGETVRAALEAGDNERALATFLAGIVGMSEAALDAYRADPVWPARVAAAPTLLREVEAEASAAASLDALGSVSVPVLLVLGSISRSPFRIGTDALAARLADARVVTITGAAHAAHHTHAAEFVRAVEAFLDAAE
jgi:pimeloyl-ACP methyl ester carboxylesterase